ncbi:hypothetical protein PHYC_03708 [Phycisphaerales bacterium]|nr:hypothetical protein PHYC_03708 [Phycisphaerales bacterium]
MSAAPAHAGMGKSANRPQPPGNDRDESLPPTLWQLVVRWVQRATVAAVTLSLLFHLAGWQVARFVMVGGVGAATAGAGDSEGAIEMAVLTEGELDAIQGADVEVSTPSVPDAPIAIETPQITTGDEGTGEGEGGGSPGEIGEIGDVGGGGDIGSGGEGLGLGGGGGGASFFGVEAVGNRFAYIVDVSASMDEFRMNALRRELHKSIEGLLETSQFMIVKYSTESTLVGTEDGWQEASSNVKRQMKGHIEALMPEDNTIPVPGFNLVFAHRPRPDAIYFMTDGDFSDDEAEAIIAMYKTFKTPVHCICLGFQGGEPRMRKIARATKGTFTFVRADR